VTYVERTEGGGGLVNYLRCYSYLGKEDGGSFGRELSPGIDSKESIPSDWKSIPGLLKRFTNSGSEERSAMFITRPLLY
jgi:hypothetical protein